MAEGYATARPAVHGRVIEMAAGPGRRFHRALDVGCGAGLSAAPLEGIAEIVIGIEPVEAMLGPARRTSPNTLFAAASGEAIPLRAGSIDLISAAGSLNYLDPDRFFPEAARVLAPGGAALVYDFSPGRSFRDSEALDEWFAEFERRYPRPKGEAREINPEILAGLDRRFEGAGARPVRDRDPARPGVLRRVHDDRDQRGAGDSPGDSVRGDSRVVRRNAGAGVPGARLGRFCSAAILSGWRGSRNDSDRCAGPAGRQPCLTEQRGRALIRSLP